MPNYLEIVKDTTGRIKKPKVEILDVSDKLNNYLSDKMKDNTYFGREYPTLNELYGLAKSYIKNREKINAKQAIPYIKEKKIKLSNAGKLNGAEFSSNLLDSIAINYGRSGGKNLNIMLGLPGQESALGTANKRGYISQINKGVIYPTTLVSNWTYPIDGSYPSAINYIFRDDADLATKEDRAKKGMNYAKQTAVKKDKPNEPVLVNAYKKFDRGDYNRNDKSHTSDVINTGRFIWNSPEIKKWWSSSGEKLYKQGLIESNNYK